MRIKIELLSDLCTCSGETYNSIVDMDIVYDENGIPYIPAKRIKGCIREAALEMCEMGLMDRNQYVHIFGEAGSKKSTFLFQMPILQIIRIRFVHCSVLV